MEIWKDVVGYEGLYQVSNLGRLKGLSKIDQRGYRRKEKILNPGINSSGYRVANLYKDGKMKSHQLHQIVARTFLPNPVNKVEVNHIDGNKSNNSLENLEWVNRFENMRHAFSTGLNRGHGGSRGEKQGRSKLTKKQVLEILQRLKQGEKQKALAREFGVCRQHISSIKRRECWDWLTSELEGGL